MFVVSVGIGTERLSKRGVICSEPARLLVAGKVKVCCFDKTGTLTNPGMSFSCVKVFDASAGTYGIEESKAPSGSPLEMAMSTCHSLGVLNSSSGKTLVGTMVDKAMFESTGWALDQKTSGNVVSCGSRALSVVRAYSFDHKRMTSSVIVCENDKHTIFVKGSAEAIVAACGKKSKGLQLFSEEAERFSREGCYTIAFGYRSCSTAEEKSLASNKILDRAQVETELILAGIMVLRNDLKPGSVDAVHDLREGGCRVIMLTGDHVLTGKYIADKVGMFVSSRLILRSNTLKANGEVEWLDESDSVVDVSLDALEPFELVVTGDIWRNVTASSQARMLQYVRVFARMNPDDKVRNDTTLVKYIVTIPPVSSFIVARGQSIYW